MSRKPLSHRNPSLEDLPEELVFDILSRLSVTTIICCKCVCKRLRNLVLEIRLPKCLIIYQYRPVLFLVGQPVVLKFMEIEKELDHDNLLRGPFMGIDMTKLCPRSFIFVAGSIDGLVCLWAHKDGCDSTYICNPMTREYVVIPKQKFDAKNFWDVKYDFGVSLAGEYKVIRIVTGGPTKKIEVYTLGSHQWRNLDVPCELNSPRCFHNGLYFNGHIYWILGKKLLSFNLDTEKFQLFPLPPPRQKHRCLGILKGCLCVLHESDKTFIFSVLTKEHEMKKYWHRELEIAKSTFKEMCPIGFIDGSNDQSLLIVQNRENRQLVAYCLETGKFEDTRLSGISFQIYDYRPSFLKLGNFQSSAIHVF